MENTPKKNLTDQDFYQQACSYFYYHAEQRTTMINYFIAVFGASIALYGSLIKEYTIASVLIAVFLTIVSVLFFMIDLRNKFDVKESENVIRQIERDYGMDKPSGEYAYGVFSNETNVYRYYGYGQRRDKGKAYKDLRKTYKNVLHGKVSRELLNAQIKDYVEKDGTVSFHEVSQSLGKGFIIPLSFCIKMLYIVCMAISVLALIFALLLTFGTI